MTVKKYINNYIRLNVLRIILKFYLPVLHIWEAKWDIQYLYYVSLCHQ